MRRRIAAASLALALPIAGIVVLVAASPASAMEELTEEQLEELRGSLSEEDFECIEEQAHKVLNAEEGGEIEPLTTCEEAPNPILPAWNELIWAVISFSVLLVVMGKFALPALRKGLEGREQAVRGDLEAAEQAKADAEQTLDEYKRQLAEARNEAARIIEEARQAADAMRREVAESAEAEASAARERAQADIDQTVARARGDLQREVADFAVRLAERIVERNLDRDAQQALIDQYISEVGALGGNGRSGANGGSGGSGGSASDN